MARLALLFGIKISIDQRIIQKSEVDEGKEREELSKSIKLYFLSFRQFGFHANNGSFQGFLSLICTEGRLNKDIALVVFKESNESFKYNRKFFSAHEKIQSRNSILIDGRMYEISYVFSFL